jgi:hypothetical protein
MADPDAGSRRETRHTTWRIQIDRGVYQVVSSKVDPPGLCSSECRKSRWLRTINNSSTKMILQRWRLRMALFGALMLWWTIIVAVMLAERSK